MRRLSTPISLMLFAWTGAQAATPIQSGQVLYQQRFEWIRSFPDRSQGDYGVYTIPLEMGATYEFITANPVGGNTRDTYLYLRDPAGNIVAADDNSGGEKLARIRYTAATAGTHALLLRAGPKGKYGLCDVTALLAASPPLTVGPG